MKEKGRWRGQGRILRSQVANLPDLAVAASFDGWQDYIEIGLAGWQFRELAVAGRIVILTPVPGMAECEVRWLAVSGQQFLAGWQFRCHRWPPAAVAGIAQSARDNSLHQVPPLPEPGIGIAVTQELGTMCKISKSAHLSILSTF